MRARWELTIEQVFNVTGRGVAVIGEHRGGDIASGDSVRLSTGGPVPEVFVEFHHPPGKVALLLRDVVRDQVQEGAVLSGQGPGVFRDCPF